MDFIADFKEYFTHNSIFCVGLLLLAGYCAGEIAKRFRLPSITGYIIAGLLVGESVSGLIPVEIKHYLENVTRVALALIAVTIGAEFKIAKLKRSGLKIFLLTVFEACFASISVFLVFRLLGFEIRYALILGAIAAATAPAATVVIARQLKARGEFVEYLFGVVAFDDAVCIILFSIVFAIVAPLLTGSVMAGNGVVISGFIHAVEEIGFSFVLGVLGGLILHLFTRKANSQKELLLVSIATVLVVTAISVMLHLSLLIANMALGAVLVNISDKGKKIFKSIIPVTPPLFAMFFVLAGSELDIGIFSKGIVVFFGIMYVSARFAGKYAGVFFASLIARIPSRIWKYLGFCLFPQAGVAIGLVLFIRTSPVLKNAAPEVQTSLVLIVNIVLLSIFISELIGPSISKFGILRGAERD
ncbi:cation:proton antiporter [Planctomycetota bacterium]